MYIFLKRLIDIVASVIALILLSPIFIVVIILLKFTGEGEVFYGQNRVGFKNEYFKIWKFATMLKDSPNMGTGSITLRGDPRVTAVGKYLRITKINELPQFINILNGTMTLVGPRPHMKVDFDLYPTHVKEIIFNIKPGVTGIGSIVFRDQEDLFTKANMDPHVYYEQTLAPYKGELELWYQKNASLYLDLMIIFLTVWVIFVPKSDLHFRIFKDLPKCSF